MVTEKSQYPLFIIDIRTWGVFGWIFGIVNALRLSYDPNDSTEAVIGKREYSTLYSTAFAS